MSKVALITGITGQDGAYLAQHLLSRGYQVHGLRQPVVFPDLDSLRSLLGDDLNAITLHYGDLTDAAGLAGLISKIQPDEIYNLAGQSHVHVSFAVPDLTLQVNGSGVTALLEIVRSHHPRKQIKFFQASTSELFGEAAPPQNELTPMTPRSPYAAAKLYAFNMVKIYREAYGLFAVNAIMFNHESPLRGEEFVTRKIAKAVAAIVNGQQTALSLGNLDARRDWSHARDVMIAAHMTMQADRADDFVISSGVSHTVREFATAAFAVAGIKLEWSGEGIHETAVNSRTGQTLVRVDSALFRPLEVDNLCGDSQKIRSQLGWQNQTSFHDLVKEMVMTELAAPAATERQATKDKSYA